MPDLYHLLHRYTGMIRWSVVATREEIAAVNPGPNWRYVPARFVPHQKPETRQ